MSEMVDVARVPLYDAAAIQLAPRALMSPYDLDEQAIIRPAEDFTISINTVSKQLYSQYANQYKAGEHGNDYFVLLSQFGLGDQTKPSTRLHLLDNISGIHKDFISIWGENVQIVEDYQSDDGSPQRVYLAFNSFCQTLGNTKWQDFLEIGNKILHKAGAIIPALMPFTTMGQVVAEGVKNILSKTLNHPGECQEVTFNLYPIDTTVANGAHPQRSAGEAPLQAGHYILFFENTSLENLVLLKDGTVQTTNGQPVPPYIVVNIKRGKMLAPGAAPESLNTGIAMEVMEHYERNFGFVASDDKHQLTGGILDAMETFGKSMRQIKQFDRYYALKRKGDQRTETETQRFIELGKELARAFPDWDGGHSA